MSTPKTLGISIDFTPLNRMQWSSACVEISRSFIGASSSSHHPRSLIRGGRVVVVGHSDNILRNWEMLGDFPELCTPREVGFDGESRRTRKSKVHFSGFFHFVEKSQSAFMYELKFEIWIFRWKINGHLIPTHLYPK